MTNPQERRFRVVLQDPTSGDRHTVEVVVDHPWYYRLYRSAARAAGLDGAELIEMCRVSDVDGRVPEGDGRVPEG